jgi:dTDP-4-amino-4,6-dideoxygalactose transaminase
MTSAIPFFLHDLGSAEATAFEGALSDPILTSGDAVAEFEKRFAATLGRAHAIGVTSSTAALRLSLLALRIGHGDEVITSPLAFVGTATAIIESGARIVFADVEPDTGNIDPERIEAAITPRTRAIVPVHLYGQMADMRAIRGIADRHGLRIVEDASHSIEGRRDGIGPGEIGDAACFSFYATHSLTCGEGGAVVTDSDELAARLRSLRLYGVTKTGADRTREGYQPWDMTDLGLKCGLDNLHAAILLPQLLRLDANLLRRHELAAEYERRLVRIHDLWWPRTRPHVLHARHLFPVWVGQGRRDELMSALQSRGIGVSVNYPAIHLLTYFRQHFGYVPGDFPATERLSASVLSLPLYPRLPMERVSHIASAVADVLGRVGQRGDRPRATVSQPSEQPSTTTST